MKLKEKTVTGRGRKYVLDLISQNLSNNIETLPAMRKLASDAGVSYATMRLVIDELKEQGFIEQVQGSGTFISGQAESLLKEYSIKKLVYFRPHHFGTPEESYHEWLASHLMQAAKKNNWNISTITVSSHDEFFSRVKDVMDSADGIAYSPVGETYSLEQMAKFKILTNVPFVILNEFPGASLNDITIDNRHGGALAAKHFIQHKHRKIGLLICEPRTLCTMQRVRGFQNCLELAGIEPVIIDCNVQRDDNRYDRAFETLSNRIKAGLDVTALFAVSDYGAWGAIDAIKSCGKSTPGDISLIGFDGLPFTDKLIPKLTTIKQPVESIAQKVFDILNNTSEGEYQKILIKPEIKEGASVINSFCEEPILFA